MTPDAGHGTGLGHLGVLGQAERHVRHTAGDAPAQLNHELRLVASAVGTVLPVRHNHVAVAGSHTVL